MSHNNKYLVKIAEIDAKEGSYGSPSSVMSNRYLEKIAETYGMEKVAWGFLVPMAGAALRAGAGMLARSSIGRAAISKGSRMLAGAGRQIFGSQSLRNAAARNAAGGPIPGNVLPTARGALAYNMARASNALGRVGSSLRSTRVGQAAGSAATGVGNAASGIKGALSSSGFRRKAMTANAVVGTAGNAMMVKDLVSGAGSSASQQATQAAASSGQRAMAAAQRPQLQNGGWGGGNPGWNMQGANAF